MIVGFFIDSHIYKEAMHLYNYIGAILLFIGTFFILSKILKFNNSLVGLKN